MTATYDLIEGRRMDERWWREKKGEGKSRWCSHEEVPDRCGPDLDEEKTKEIGIRSEYTPLRFEAYMANTLSHRIFFFAQIESAPGLKDEV